MVCVQHAIAKKETKMFFLDTTFTNKKTNKELYNGIFDEINTKIRKYSDFALFNYKYGFNHKLDHLVFEDLLTYREILEMKLNCDDCLCDFSTNAILAKIKKLTNSIC